MKSIVFILLFCVFLILIYVVGFLGCQSVGSNSALLRNIEGNYNEAIISAKEAVKNNPNDAEAHFQLGVSYSNLDSVALAYNHFKKSMDIDPSSKRIDLANNNIKHNYAKHYNKGQEAFQHRFYDEAALEFTKATKADPRQWEGFFNLGVTYTRLGLDNTSNYDRAIQALETALDNSTGNDRKKIENMIKELRDQDND